MVVLHCVWYTTRWRRRRRLLFPRRPRSRAHECGASRLHPWGGRGRKRKRTRCEEKPPPPPPPPGKARTFRRPEGSLGMNGHDFSLSAEATAAAADGRLCCWPPATSPSPSPSYGGGEKGEKVAIRVPSKPPPSVEEAAGGLDVAYVRTLKKKPNDPQ